jgi:hypothetical protein
MAHSATLFLLLALAGAEDHDWDAHDLSGADAAPATRAREAAWLERDAQGEKLAPDERGLALLQSPQLAKVGYLPRTRGTPSLK